jgi:uncharacterized protein (UPF0333 family)
LNKKGQNIIEYLLLVAVVAGAVGIAVNCIRDYMRNNAQVSMHSNPGEYWDSWKEKSE